MKRNMAYAFMPVVYIFVGVALGQGPELEYLLAESEILPGTSLTGTLRFKEEYYSQTFNFRVDMTVESMSRTDDGRAGVQSISLSPTLYYRRDISLVAQGSLGRARIPWGDCTFWR